MVPSKKNPAVGFRIMGIFNMIAALVLFAFYFPYESAGGPSSYLLLLAAGVAALSSVLLFVLYGYFKKKLEGLGR